MTSFKFSALRSLGLISGLCLAMLAPSTASAILLDNFTNAFTGNVLPFFPGQLIASAGGGTVSETQGPLSGVYGSGTRMAQIGVVMPPGPFGSFLSTLATGSGVMSFSTADGSTSFFQLMYTNFTLDLSQPQLFLNVPVISNDNGGTFTLTIQSDPMHSSSGGMLLPPGGAPLNKQLPISSLMGNADLSAITKITLRFDGLNSSDISIGGGGLTIQSPVPEPSSLVIALTGLGMAGVYYRRRRKQPIA